MEELVELGKRIRKNHDALKEEPFAIYLSIDSEGKFRQFIPTEKQSVLAEALPTKQYSARLLLDRREEVLGIGKNPEKKHKRFLAKQQEYAETEAMAPVLAFYRDEDGRGLSAARKAFETQVDPKLHDKNITFMVDDRRLCDDRRILEAIISHYEASQAAQMKETPRRCSICGGTNYPVGGGSHSWKVPFSRRKIFRLHSRLIQLERLRIVRTERQRELFDMHLLRPQLCGGHELPADQRQQCPGQR